MTSERALLADSLRTARDRLRALGIRRPPYVTETRLLATMVDAGLLSEATTRRYVDLCIDVEYGGLLPERAAVEAAGSALARELATIDGQDPRLEEVREQLRPAPPLKVRTRDVATPERGALSVDDMLPRLGDGPSDGDGGATPGNGDVSTTADERGSRPVRRRKLKLAAGSALAIGLVAVGHLGTDVIDRGLDEIRYHVLGGIRRGGGERRLAALRTEAVADPDALGAWRSYAIAARQRGRAAEAVVAWRHVVARDPTDAEALNNLAWLLLTTDVAAVHDPVQGLELAERAYSLDSSPNITDTLAEAAFQNGQLQRAVDLESDALARQRTNRSFYRRQLERFRAALDAAAPGSTD